MVNSQISTRDSENQRGIASEGALIWLPDSCLAEEKKNIRTTALRGNHFPVITEISGTFHFN